MIVIKFMEANSMLVDVKAFIKAAGLTCISSLSGDNTFAYNFETVKNTMLHFLRS